MNKRKIICVLLALTMLAASLWGCAPSAQSNGKNETTESGKITESTDSTIFRDPTVSDNDPREPGVKAASKQYRVNQNGFASVFKDGFTVVSSKTELDDALDGVKNLDLSSYNDTFFTKNRLVLISTTSNNGSVRYDAMISAEDNTVKVTLKGVMDGDGTTVMTKWLVFVELPLIFYPADMIVTVPSSAAGSGEGAVK